MADLPVRTDFPREIREIENTWIPMPDGTRLAARIWLPMDAEDDPVPAILEYLPYRKRDGTVERDHLTHPYFAGFGYAGVRVDMRGTGDSEGVCLGEYLKQEQDDALAIIDWLAAQPWCSGKVGMIGISWGGFNGLQVAARQPEALGAVITLCSTDDRYADDIHFMGGAMLTDKAAWGGTAFAIANTPPDPQIVGDNWRDMWLERLQNNGLWMLDWFAHQRRDAFYAHGSICEDYDAVQVPVYAVGGYADGYTNPILRMMQNLGCPRKALIGPWAHKYPHFAAPQPRIGFLQECLRWWDQHLKGIDTGIMEEPMIRAWIQDPAPPSPHATERPGHWISHADWPVSHPTQTMHLAEGKLLPQADPEAGVIPLSSPQTAGHAAQTWCIYGVEADGPLDQRGEEGLMTVFDSAPLTEDLTIFGYPELRLRLASDVPQANLTAVLSMVAPGGAATLVSFGVLNLTHRDNHANPEPLTPGTYVEATLRLNVIGQAIPAGYRLRLALSTAYWPMLFPSAEAATLTLDPAQTQLILPLQAAETRQPLPTFGSPEGATPVESVTLKEGNSRRSREIDYATGFETYTRSSDTGTYLHAHTGLELRAANTDSFQIHPEDPNSAQVSCSWHMSYARDGWRADLETNVTVAAQAQDWHITATLTARDADGIVLTRSWDETVPRDLV